jgi:hypothetical protein
VRAPRNDARNAGKNCERADRNRPARKSEGRTKSKVVLRVIKHDSVKV